MSKVSGLKESFKRNKVIVENFSYITLLQVFILLAPLITYPYLTRVLGMDLYGLVLTAQVLASYCIILVKFGFDSVSARYVSMYRDDKGKLSEVLSSILCARLSLWVVGMLVYTIVVLLVPAYREHPLLFVFSYGLTLNVLLFPQFYFQGIEQMKFITLINVFIQVVFVAATFLVIKAPSDYIYVPLLHAIGYLLGGLLSLFIIFRKHNLHFYVPSKDRVSLYVKDAFPLFSTDAIATIKDKFSYLLLGASVGMENVVTFDVGSKLTSLILQPLTIINTVVFPKMAKDQNNSQFKRVGLLIFVCICILFILANIFLHPIVHFLVGKEIDLAPIRLFLLSPIFLGISSYTGSCMIVARGYNKYMLLSILVTTLAYIFMTLSLFFTHRLNTVMSFVMITVLTYLVELLYRIFVSYRIVKNKV